MTADPLPRPIPEKDNQMTESQGWMLIGTVFMLLASNLEPDPPATVVAVSASMMIIYGVVWYFWEKARGTIREDRKAHP